MWKYLSISLSIYLSIVCLSVSLRHVKFFLRICDNIQDIVHLYLSIHPFPLFIYLSTYLSQCSYLSIHPSISPFYLSICISIPMQLSIHPSIHFPLFYLSIYLSIPMQLSIYLSIHPSIAPFIYLSHRFSLLIKSLISTLKCRNALGFYLINRSNSPMFLCSPLHIKHLLLALTLKK